MSEHNWYVEIKLRNTVYRSMSPGKCPWMALVYCVFTSVVIVELTENISEIVEKCK